VIDNKTTFLLGKNCKMIDIQLNHKPAENKLPLSRGISSQNVGRLGKLSNGVQFALGQFDKENAT
jgi:hypothetical protein